MSAKLQEMAQISVFHGIGTPFEICNVPIKVSTDTVLVRVALATICGSDLHTVSGRRSTEVPCVLGHEVIGTVASPTVLRSAKGNPLLEGDRIIWSLTTSCGTCCYCVNKNLPQKCEAMHKYGHSPYIDGNSLSGGFSTHIQLKSGTTIYHIPDTIKNKEAVPISCALATVLNGLDTIGIYPKETAIIHGAGMLGIYAACYLHEQGYRTIVNLDRNAKRLQMAERFGATHTINTNDSSTLEIDEALKELTKGRGVDLAVEVSGAPLALSNLIEWLGIGGRCLTLGYVYPNSGISVNAHQIVRKCLTLRGIHNYHPASLGKALNFVEKVRENYPFEELIGKTYSLSDIDSAFEHAFRQDTIRIAIDPCASYTISE